MLGISNPKIIEFWQDLTEKQPIFREKIAQKWQNLFHFPLYSFAKIDIFHFLQFAL